MSHHVFDDKEVTWDRRGQKASGQSKEQQVNKAIRTGSGVVSTEKKFGGGGNGAARATIGSGASARALEEESESFHLAKPSLEMRKVLMQERMKASLTQAELAQLCNVKPTVIQEYENGKAIANSMMLGKIERALRSKNPSLEPGTLTKAQKRGPSA